VRISKIGKDRASFSIVRGGKKFHVFYHVSIVVTKVAKRKWYYVIPDSCTFPVSPMALSHYSVLVVDAESGVVKDVLGSSRLTKSFVSAIMKDYAVRVVHES
jgi:hypothetical protein